MVSCSSRERTTSSNKTIEAPYCSPHLLIRKLSIFLCQLQTNMPHELLKLMDVQLSRIKFTHNLD